MCHQFVVLPNFYNFPLKGCLVKSEEGFDSPLEDSSSSTICESQNKERDDVDHKKTQVCYISSFFVFNLSWVNGFCAPYI